MKLNKAKVMLNIIDMMVNVMSEGNGSYFFLDDIGEVEFALRRKDKNIVELYLLSPDQCKEWRDTGTFNYKYSSLLLSGCLYTLDAHCIAELFFRAIDMYISTME